MIVRERERRWHDRKGKRLCEQDYVFIAKCACGPDADAASQKEQLSDLSLSLSLPLSFFCLPALPALPA